MIGHVRPYGCALARMELARHWGAEDDGEDMPEEPVIEGRVLGWYVGTVATEGVPLWRWAELDAGEWAVVMAVKEAFRAGVEVARDEARAQGRG